MQPTFIVTADPVLQESIQSVLEQAGLSERYVVTGTPPDDAHADLIKPEQLFPPPLRIGRFLDYLEIHRQNYEAGPVRVGPFTLDPLEMTLSRAEPPPEKQIAVTDKERDILMFLVRCGDAGAAREVLLHHVWGYKDTVETHTLETHIYRLRQKIEDAPASPQILITIPGGYTLRT